jgi:hypothetical protein
VHPDQLALLLGAELGLFAAQLALVAGDCHPFAGSHPEQVDFELCEGGQDVEEHLPIGSAGS